MQAMRRALSVSPAQGVSLAQVGLRVERDGAGSAMALNVAHHEEGTLTQDEAEGMSPDLVDHRVALAGGVTLVQAARASVLKAQDALTDAMMFHQGARRDGPEGLSARRAHLEVHGPRETADALKMREARGAAPQGVAANVQSAE